MTKVPISVLSLVATLALASAPVATAHTGATTVRVSGGEFFFKLSTSTIPAPGRITFVFKNVGHVAHNFKIAGKETPLVSPGKTTSIVITFKKAGKYAYLCTVPGHAAAGMKGVLTVR